MINNDFYRINYDSCIYYKQINDSKIYLLLYVDDMLISCKEKKHLNTVKGILKSEFGIKDLGHARKILGIEISKDRENKLLYLSQESYISKVLKRFVMDHLKTISTPIGQQFKLSITQALEYAEEKEFMHKIPYASMIGSIMYAIVCSRPNLT